MNTDSKDTPNPQALADAAKDAAQRATEAAKELAKNATTTAKDAVHQATDAARNCCATVSAKVEDSAVRAQECVKQNPLAMVLGAVALGVAVGCLVALSSRPRLTLRERFVDDPVQTTRDTLYAALAPVAQQLHEGYDSARSGAGNLLSGLQCRGDSWTNQLGRVGNNLKFW
jgi:ElaB/YqjD/DUF883 family membrane-anchored ribosome-binding protein